MEYREISRRKKEKREKEKGKKKKEIGGQVDSKEIALNIMGSECCAFGKGGGGDAKFEKTLARWLSW